MNDKDSIIKKIKNLFDLSKSDSQNEAALALSKAKELMDKYGINDSDLIIANIKESKSFACRGKRPPSYLVLLAEGLCELFGCEFYNSVRYDYDVRGWFDDFIFVGFNPQQEICKYAFNVLSRQLKYDRKQYLKSLSKEYNRNRPARADAFALGWSEAVFYKVKELVPDKEVKINSEYGLIKVNMLTEHVESKTNGSFTPKSSPKSAVDSLRGYEKGEQVEIHKGMDHREKMMVC